MPEPTTAALVIPDTESESANTGVNESLTTNGAYGIYPVESKDVLIDSVLVRGASDAGIYVGQSRNIIVRHSTAVENVAGIEIENSFEAC